MCVESAFELGCHQVSELVDQDTFKSHVDMDQFGRLVRIVCSFCVWGLGKLGVEAILDSYLFRVDRMGET